MGIFLGIASQKGGVGRSTVAVNLGHSLAKRGWRVLLVDGDLQGGLGFSLTEKAKDAHGFFDVLLNPGWEQSIGQFPLKTNLPQFDILTRGTRETIDWVLHDPGGQWAGPDRLRVVRESLGRLGYDILVFDSQAGITRLGLSLCGAMDAILVPEQPTPLCLRSLPQMLRTLAHLKQQNGNRGVPGLAGFVFSMVDVDDPRAAESQRQFRELLPPELVLETMIPRQDDILEANRAGLPVAVLSQHPTISGTTFDRLASEVEVRLGMTPIAGNVRGSTR